MMLYLIVFLWAAKCWEIILCRSLAFLLALGAEALTALVSDSLSKDVCLAKDLAGQRYWLPLEQRAGLFTAQCNQETVFLLSKGGFLKLRGL